ncbi:hypothetical protein [Pelagibaculum spongiae]|uniref:Outer membrane lipoprotein BamD-like domain-containing protein n=1 Tax=Pelagibaculum spongiae TaxID=2080658 RepID=A0A2V1H442_9GAMM|nr:hypothetical protein [Pelagibaculum spongiae]PVZ71545.1 hypothetical protein DC094_00415 [Pelagibaculum spongiae]
MYRLLICFLCLFLAQNVYAKDCSEEWAGLRSQYSKKELSLEEAGQKWEGTSQCKNASIYYEKLIAIYIESGQHKLAENVLKEFLLRFPKKRVLSKKMGLDIQYSLLVESDSKEWEAYREVALGYKKIWNEYDDGRSYVKYISVLYSANLKGLIDDSFIRPAISSLEMLKSNGYLEFEVFYNLVFLYADIGDYNSAKKNIDYLYGFDESVFLIYGLLAKKSAHVYRKLGNEKIANYLESL